MRGLPRAEPYPRLGLVERGAPTIENSRLPAGPRVFASHRTALAPRVKVAWGLGAFGIFSLLYLFTFLPLGVFGLSASLAFGATMILAPPVVAAFLIATWVQLAYENAWYALLHEDLVVAGGVWYKRRIYVPYGRIQNVNVTRTVFDRLLGLSRLTIDTAGVGFAEGVIPGVETPEPIVAEVMARAEEARLARARWATPHEADALAYEQIRRSLRELIIQANAAAAARDKAGEV